MKRSILLGLAIFLTIATKAQVTIGSELTPNTGALLDIKEFASTSTNLSTANKGFNLPRVSLQAANKLEPCATTNVTNNRNHTGMFVYNTTTNPELTPGIYYWNGVNWIRMVTELPKSQLNLLNLNVKAQATEDGLSNGSGGITLDIDTITIPDDGSYAFNFRLYGGIDVPHTTPKRSIFYLSAWADGIMVDIAEINISTVKDITRYTYSVALGCTVNAGQKIVFKLSHIPSTPYPWEIENLAVGQITAARTSMIWWKL